MKIVLANSDYKTHMTDEGNQLQEGLRSARWDLHGFGYNGITNAEKVINTYKPDYVFVQDKRDWDKLNGGCFDKRVSWGNIGALAAYPGKVITVLKDAGSMYHYQREFIEDEIKADAVVIYYHEKTVKKLNPYLEKKKLIRTYHTIDRAKIPPLDKTRGAVISGALGKLIYPLRCYLWDHCHDFGLDRMLHPGYHNLKRHTEEYLGALSRYRVSVATCSKYGFALRKIFEAVACGCVCITNLPEWDVLPGIDGALVRINSQMEVEEIRDIIRGEVNLYCEEEARHYQKICLDLYDYRVQGELLDKAILKG